MKTAEEIFQEVNGFGAIGNNVSITLTKKNIYYAMEKYADQFRSKCEHERHYSEIDGFAYCKKCGEIMQ